MFFGAEKVLEEIFDWSFHQETVFLIESFTHDPACTGPYFVGGHSVLFM